MVKRKAEASKLEDSQKKKAKSRKLVETAYNSSQKAAISEFSSVTQADKTTAAKILKQHNWNVSAAANSFFNNPSSGNGSASKIRTSLNSTFDRFREDPVQTPNEIDLDGTGKLLQELGLDLGDVSAFVFFELVQSPSLGVITREGFVDGWADVGEDSLPKMRNIVLQRRSQLATDRDLFKSVYNHAFVLTLGERQKAAPMDMALDFWRSLFTDPSLEWSSKDTPWREWWLEYYEKNVKRAVNKDLWKQTLTFAMQTLQDDSLSFWNEESSWPSVIDEFVLWVKSEKRSGGEAMEVE